MARIRSVKPSLRTSRVVAQWAFDVRYFWVLLWGYLDDKGRGLDIPKAIAGDCYPLDDNVTAKTIDRWLNLMAATKVEPDRTPPVCRYQVAGTRYLHAVNWDEHQRPNRPSASPHPPCPVHEGLTEPGSERPYDPQVSRSVSPHVLEFEGLTAGEFEGAAREPVSEPPGPSSQGPPSPKCDKHRNTAKPPDCGACADARRAAEAWHAERRAAIRSAPKCRVHRGELAANCRLCAAEAKGAA